MRNEIKNVVIVGAGFSKNFRLPLVNEIFPKGYHRVVSKWPDFDLKFPMEWMRLIDGRPYETMNYEQMLSRVDLEITYLSDYQNDNIKYSLWHLRDSIIQIFWEGLNKKYNDDDIETLKKYFTCFKPPIAIISFNQDLLLESCFEQCEIKWSYGIQESNFTYPRPEKHEVFFLKSKNSKNKARNNPTFKFYDYKNPSFVLVKPHGSFNWQFCPLCHDVQIVPLSEAGVVGRPYAPISDVGRHCTKTSCIKKAKAQPAYNNLIVPPTIYKDFDNPLLRLMWQQAKTFLKEAEYIHVIGYSFSSVDVMANWMLYEALLENVCLKEIIIVDPNEDVPKNIENQLPENYQSLITRKNYFNEYLDSIIND
ncbi:MAG: hypothetical protein ACTSWK_10150 [Promethearchaeota archaeon]